MSQKSFRVILTQGAITNGYINIRGHNGFFPDKYFDGASGYQNFVLHFQDKPQESTFLLSKHQRIRLRMGAYFKSQGLKEGDAAVITEESEGVYRLRFDKKGAQPSSANETTMQLENEIQKRVKQVGQPLNQILFGPPGTGKTYHTAIKALEILEPDNETLLANDYAGVRSRYDELVNEGRVNFVTFHQSFSYEDFIEGIKAETKGGAVEYSIEDGVFKKISALAASKGNYFRR